MVAAVCLHPGVCEALIEHAAELADGMLESIKKLVRLLTCCPLYPSDAADE